MVSLTKLTILVASAAAFASAARPAAQRSHRRAAMLYARQGGDNGNGTSHGNGNSNGSGMNAGSGSGSGSRSVSRQHSGSGNGSGSGQNGNSNSWGFGQNSGSTNDSGSGSGTSTSGTFSGTATFFSVGLGACGWTSLSSEYVVALPSSQYGDTSSKSSWCGKTISITNKANSKTATAKIVDACPSCSSGDLDMSRGLFGALTNDDYDEGRFSITWTVA